MKAITDEQLRKAWAHLSTDRIKALGFLTGPGEDVSRVNAARRRIIALREAEAANPPVNP